MYQNVGHKLNKLAKLSFVLIFIFTVIFPFYTNVCAANVESSNLTPPLDILWEYRLDGACNAITAANESVFVASSNQIYAFDADTGKVIWNYNANGTVILYYNNTVYTGDNRIYALNATDGTLKWLYDVNGSVEDIFVKNRVVYIATMDPAFLCALDPVTGKEIWKYNTGFDGGYIPQVYNKLITLKTSRSKERAWNPNWKAALHVINTSTGEQIWKWENESIAYLDNVLFSNNTTLVVTASLDDTKIIYSINASNFETNWALKNPDLCILLFQGACPYILPCVDNNSVYVPFHNKLESLDAITGKLNWEFEVQEPKAIDIKNGSIYICSDDKLYSVNSTTGGLNWIFKTEDTYKIFNTSSLRVEDKRCDAFRVYFLDDTVFLFSGNNYFYSLDPLGIFKWGIQLDPRFSIYPSYLVAQNGVLYTTAHGPLYMIDLKKGTLLQEINTEGGTPDFTKNALFFHTPEGRITALSSVKIVAPRTIEVAQSAIDACIGKTNVLGSQDLLERAKATLARENYSTAIQYAKEAKESVIVPFITSAETSIKWCNLIYASASEAENLLENAQTSYMSRDFLNAINQAVKAKESADESMKTRLIQYILILLVSVFAIILLYRYGLLKGVIVVINVRYWQLFLISVLFCLLGYLAWYAVDLTWKLPDPFSVLIVGYTVLLLGPLCLYAARNSLPRKGVLFLKIIISFCFCLFLIFPIFLLGIVIIIFVTIMHVCHSSELFIDMSVITTIQLYGHIIVHIFFYISVVIVPFLSISVIWILIKYNKLLALESKAAVYYKKGEYKKAIDFVNKGLSILMEMNGFLVKIDPFYKIALQSCHSALSECYYMLGDYDNAIKNLKNVGELDNETIESIYRGETDISRLIAEETELRIFENNMFKKYLKIKGLIKKPEIFKKIKFEHVLVVGLILVFGLYVYTILTTDYTDCLFILQPYPKINQVVIWLGFCSLLIFSIIFILFTILKVESGYSKNSFDLFNRSPIESEEILRKEKRFKSLYKLLSLSLVFFCLLYAVQSTTWFGFEMPLLSIKLGLLFIFINIGTPILSFIYSILLLSVVSDFISSIFIFTKAQYDEFGLGPIFGAIIYFFIIICLMVFTPVFSLLLDSVEGSTLDWVFGRSLTYNFQQVLLLFIIAISVFSIALFFVYQGFITGSNKLIGDTYYNEGRYSEACYRYKKIDEYVSHIMNKIINKIFFPLAYTFLSNLYMAYGASKFRLGEKEEALTLLNKSLEYAEKGYLTSYLWQIHYKIGQIKEEEGKLDDAYENYKKSIDNIEDLRELVKLPERKEAFFENKAEVYAKMVFICLRLEIKKYEEAFNYAERAKGRVFLELLGTKKVKSRVRPELKEKEDELLRKIRVIYVKLSERREERYSLELSNLTKEYDELLLKIKEDDPEYYSLRKVEPLKLQEIQSLLTRNELVFEFFVGDEVIAFIIQKDGMSVERIPITKKELEAKILDLREKIDSVQMPSIEGVANELYEGLIRKLEPMLNGKDLIIVPHGILHYLPFNALHDSKSWFIEKYNARFLQNASMQRFLKEKRKGMIRSALVVGNPTKNLKDAEEEAIEVAHKFNVKPLLRDDAKKDVVIENSINKDLLHFACHAEFEAGNPKLSRLILADGDLFVTEVYSLDLNADLVTLSACKTGLGGLTNGDEVEGLTRAFMRAGTPSVIASLWAVGDESTSELFLKYYEGEGDKVKRLKAAQIAIMKKYGHPYYWAGFVMFGER